MADVLFTIITIVAGSLMCFEGYKLFRLCLGIAGGVAGFVLGNFVVEISTQAGLVWNETAKTVVMLVFVAGLAVLSFALYMKALIAITTIICAFWFHDDFGFIFSGIENQGVRIAVTYGAGLVAGVLIGVIVYYAQKWTISLATAYAGARMISGVLAPVLWSGILSDEYAAGIIEQRMLLDGVGFNFSMIQIIVLVAFCSSGFVIQLKTSRK